MKINLKYLFISLSVVILTGGCHEEEFPEPILLEDANSFCSEFHSDNVNAIRNYLLSSGKLKTRSAEESVHPYVVDGDTVMFIANYNEGWEVFSNDIRLPMSLIKSDAGSFYPASLNLPTPFEQFFNATAHRLSVLKKSPVSEKDTINSDWLAYGLVSPKDGEVISTRDSDNERYEWRWAATTVDTHEELTLTSKGGRLKTEWDQENNFNLYTPYYIDRRDTHVLAGCVAIALGQFFYHSNKYFGFPISGPTSATYNSSTNRYVFSNFSSIIWNKLNNGPSFENNINTMQTTALYIGWIGMSVDMNWGLYYGLGSGASLDGKTLIFFNSQTGLNANCESFTTDKSKNLLSRGYPVIAGLMDPIYGGHTVLIDYYFEESGGYDTFYVYRKINGGGVTDTEDQPDFSDSPTFEELAEIFGAENVRIEPHRYSRHIYKVNWGWNGEHNDFEVSAASAIWSTPNGYNFEKYQMINF